MLASVGGLRKKVCADAIPLKIRALNPLNRAKLSLVMAMDCKESIVLGDFTASRGLECLLLQQHVELQKLFVGELLSAAGLQLLLQKCPCLLGLPAQFF